MQFRVALTVSDVDQALSFFRDVLGLPVQQEWDAGEGRGVVLAIPQATLEILDPEHSAFVDRVETARQSSGRVRPGQVRFAFEVPNLQDAVAAAGAAGVPLVNEPVETPWKDLNARVAGPDGLQVTLFQTPP
jgi:methylmalonyl-CoA/ethylmalonyl-CoA epimerase